MLEFDQNGLLMPSKNIACTVETELSLALFENCDFAYAIFNETVLEKADFRTAYNYIINAETNRIKRAKFSNTGLAGLLEKYELDIS